MNEKIEKSCLNCKKIWMCEMVAFFGKRWNQLKKQILCKKCNHVNSIKQEDDINLMNDLNRLIASYCNHYESNDK